MKTFNKIIFVIIVISLQACREELRGNVEKSNDGETYLVFENGCDSVFVNGKFWTHAKGVKGQVQSGNCEIDCNNDGIDLSINIGEGTIFFFDYWGP